MLWFTLIRPGAVLLTLLGCTAALADDLVVGQLASATNPLTRAIAAEYTQGIALGLRHVNAEGGVQGRPVKLVTYDDNFEPARTLQGAQQLVEKDGAVALVGGMGTQTTMKLVDDRFLERHQIANFAPLTGLNQALSAPNVFPVRASFDDEVRAMLAHAANLQREKVAFIYLEAGAGPALSRQVEGWARAAKVKLVANVGFKSAADAQAQSGAIGSALATLGSERPDAAILIAVGAPYAAMVKALRERLGGWMPIYSLGQVNVDDLIQAVGAPTARNVSLTQVMPSPRSVDLRITRDFAEDRLRWAPQLPPTYIALEALRRRPRTWRGIAPRQAADARGRAGRRAGRGRPQRGGLPGAVPAAGPPFAAAGGHDLAGPGGAPHPLTFARARAQPFAPFPNA